MEELGNKVAFTVPVLGGVPVAESVVVTWIVMAALIALALALTRRLSVDRPGKVQCALEWTVEFLNGFVKTNIGAHWRPFAPWLGTVALYIGTSSLSISMMMKAPRMLPNRRIHSARGRMATSIRLMGMSSGMGSANFFRPPARPL